jgi:hypothetical protein
VGLGELIDKQLEIALDQVDALRCGDDSDAATLGMGVANAANKTTSFEAGGVATYKNVEPGVGLRLQALTDGHEREDFGSRIV